MVWHPLSLALAITLNTGLPAATPLRACAGDSALRTRFEFTSNSWLNLFNFLIKRAKTSLAIEDDGLGGRGYATEDTIAARPLTHSETVDWSSAVAFFAQEVVPERLGLDSLVLNINDVLARMTPNEDIDGTSLPLELRRAMRTAMPVYRSVWWPTHDRRNREWITSMLAVLSGNEECLVDRAEAVFRAPWPARPISVYATVYATWFGAYSTRPPTRITVSANARGSQAIYGVEVLLHETGHSMLGPLDSALNREAARRGKSLPPEFSHLVLFYTAGALVEEMQPRYVPYAEQFGIWRRDAFTRRSHDVIAREWQPYLSGSRQFDEAVAALVDGIT